MVYNIEVDGEHVFYVGESGVLVHNASAPTGFGAFGRAPLTFGSNFAKKIRKHIDQVRNRVAGQIDRIPSPGQGGVDRMQRIIQDRIAQGGGVRTTFGGENVWSFRDGGVS